VGHIVTQLVEALRYKQEGHGFDWWCHRHYPSSRPCFDTASNRMSTRNISWRIKAAAA